MSYRFYNRKQKEKNNHLQAKQVEVPCDTTEFDIKNDTSIKQAPLNVATKTVNTKGEERSATVAANESIHLACSISDLSDADLSTEQERHASMDMSVVSTTISTTTTKQLLLFDR